MNPYCSISFNYFSFSRCNLIFSLSGWFWLSGVLGFDASNGLTGCIKIPKESASSCVPELTSIPISLYSAFVFSSNVITSFLRVKISFCSSPNP